MQTAELIDVALMAALHGPKLVVGSTGPELVGLEDYWTASKCRFDRWSGALARIRNGEPPTIDGRPTSVRGLFEEILGGEVLTRIWTAVVSAFDRRRDGQDNDILARSVYIGHQEMRQRVLKLLVGAPGLTSVEAVELNRLRRRAEQWTDMLLALLTANEETAEFAFEAARVRQYAATLPPAGTADSAGRNPIEVLQATLRTLVRHALIEPAPSPDLNARTAAAVLAGFEPDLFDHFGLFRSLWLMRLMTTADDAQRMTNDYFRIAASPDAAAPPFSRRFP
jgi:hypothetical protein